MSEHSLFFIRDWLEPAYRAECSCGWLGRKEHETEAAAADEWENHCDVVFMVATLAAEFGSQGGSDATT